MNSPYVLKIHQLLSQRIDALKIQVRGLKKNLDENTYRQHPLVKFAYRVRKSIEEIIPENPDRPDYRLTGELKKYRRYKQGLQRYRLFFCFSNQPRIILYLYLNDERHLRKEGDKNDPYEVFKKFIKQGVFSHDPENQEIQEWIREYH
jgi:toxin YhaV